MKLTIINSFFEESEDTNALNINLRAAAHVISILTNLLSEM